MLNKKNPDLETIVNIAKTCEVTQLHLRTMAGSGDIHKVTGQKFRCKKHMMGISQKCSEYRFCDGRHPILGKNMPCLGKNMPCVEAISGLDTQSDDSAVLWNGDQSKPCQISDTLWCIWQCDSIEVPLRDWHAKSQNSVKLRMRNGTTMESVRNCRIKLINSMSGKKFRAPFVVVEECLTPLLSCKTAEQMLDIWFIFQSHLIEHWVFYLVGLKGQRSLSDLSMDEDATQSVRPARRSAVALKSKVKEKLDSMVERQVLAKVDQPTY